MLAPFTAYAEKNGTATTVKETLIVKSSRLYVDDDNKIKYFVVSWNNKHYAYVRIVKFDVKKGKTYTVNSIYVSPNGKRLAANISLEEREYMLVDGKRGKDYYENHR